jgi:hypothetical protein
MATLLSELRNELAELEDAVRAYESGPTPEACEFICIRSRAALATFEELACWTRCIDREMQSRLRTILDRAVELLEGELREGDDAYRYLDRLRQRRDRVTHFELSMLDHRLPLPS